MKSRAAKSFFVLVVVLAGLACLGWAKYLSLYARLALGEDQVSYFVEAVDKASGEAGSEQIPNFIEAVENYYPSGTKQSTGTRIDRIVERVRHLAIQQLNMLGSTNKLGRSFDTNGWTSYK